MKLILSLEVCLILTASAMPQKKIRKRVPQTQNNIQFTFADEAIADRVIKALKFVS